MDLDNSSVIYIKFLLVSASLWVTSLGRGRWQTFTHLSRKKKSCLAWSRREGNRDKKLAFFQHILSARLCARKYQKPSLKIKVRNICLNIWMLHIGGWGWGKRHQFLFSTLCSILTFQLHLFYFNYAYKQVWFTLALFLHMRKVWLNNIRSFFFFFARSHS